MKETFTTSVAVSGKGDTKAKAFADALSRVQHEVLRNANKILLRIEPQDVKVVRALERVTTEKFLFFFLAIFIGNASWPDLNLVGFPPVLKFLCHYGKVDAIYAYLREHLHRKVFWHSVIQFNGIGILLIARNKGLK